MSRLWATGAAVRCYPAWWRQLYGEEVAQLTRDLVGDGRSQRRLAVLPIALWGSEVPTKVQIFSGPGGAQLVGSPSTEVLTSSFEVLRLLILLSLPVGLAAWFAMRKAIRGLPTAPRSMRMLLRVPWLFFAVLAGLDQERRRLLSPVPHVAGLGVRPPATVPRPGYPALAHTLLATEWATLFVGVAATMVVLGEVARRCDVRLPSIGSGLQFSRALALTLTVMALCAVAGAAASAAHGITFSAITSIDVPTTPLRAGIPPVRVGATVVAPHWLLLAVPLGVAAAMSLAGWRSARRAQSVLWNLAPHP